jgi:hypothetical protein
MNKSWSDDNDDGLLPLLSNGQRLIIIYEGEENGFAPNALLAWKSQQAAGGYSHQMNTNKYAL